MAGDWIPMKVDLWECPEVVRILSAICPQNVRDVSATCPHDVHTMSERTRAKCEVIGALHRTWSLFDQHSDDGVLHGYDAFSLNEAVGIHNWAENLQHVGWLIINEDSLEMPGFSRFLGQSAKKRIKDAERKRRVRSLSEKERTDVRVMSEKCPQKNGPEKRTEQKRTRKQKRVNTDGSQGVKSQSQYTTSFEQFWESYPPPRKRDKRDAFKAWNSELAKGASAELLIQKAKEYASSDLGSGEFSKMPAAWLRAGAYEDPRESWSKASQTRADRISVEELNDPSTWTKGEDGVWRDRDGFRRKAPANAK